MNIAVIGLGLIGGSIAKTIREKTTHKVYGDDISDTVVCRAKLIDAVDGKVDEKKLKSCAVIIVALYPKDTIQWIKDNQKIISPNTIVIDTSGIKTSICSQCGDIATENGFVFIGAHPMAGVEKTGFEASRGNMFNGASMILTPSEGTSIESVDEVRKLCVEMGFGKVVITNPQEHDNRIAYTSQLAHIVSSAYVQSPTSLKHQGFSAGSYRDMTRVATLNEDMWTELFLENDEPLEQELATLIERLTDYHTALKARDDQELRRMLRAGRLQKAKADGKEL